MKHINTKADICDDLLLTGTGGIFLFKFYTREGKMSDCVSSCREFSLARDFRFSISVSGFAFGKNRMRFWYVAVCFYLVFLFSLSLCEWNRIFPGLAGCCVQFSRFSHTL